MSNDKSPVRVEIERQILAALSGSDRPMTLRELVPIVDAAEDPQQIARILGYMRADGQIANGSDVQPDEPGGLSGKGARPVASYQISEGNPMTKPEPAILQGESADIDLIAALKMSTAEDDDAEACLDSAGNSHNGDEFEMPISGLGELQNCEDYTFEHDLIMTRQIADDSLIDIASALLAGNATWAAAKRMHAAVTTFASDYV
jgi:hypothetical protein